jgi:quinoprotein glucose dehydrogenase
VKHWVFDPAVHNERMYSMGNNRGLSFFSGKDLAGTQVQRLFYAVGPCLYSLDASTGKLVTSFGEDGRISLETGLGEAAQNQFIVSNTPGIISGDASIKKTSTLSTILLIRRHVCSCPNSTAVASSSHQV